MTSEKINIRSEIDLDDVGSCHSDVNRTGSSFGTFVNIVCAMAGTGILGLPYALKQGGWLAVTLFFLGAAMAIYTSRMLIECLYYKPGSRLKEFPDIGEAAFGKFGRYFVKVFHYSASLSLACIYILLAGLNINRIILDYVGQEIISQKAAGSSFRDRGNGTICSTQVPQRSYYSFRVWSTVYCFRSGCCCSTRIHGHQRSQLHHARDPSASFQRPSSRLLDHLLLIHR
ncbi:hypothetical protein DSO57_1039321 [Entomophthora muscae]|uniref:Uncharacterized protein n=1 Tax=Entomophthora muscae TaxID=34485 RepID=A0ACC2T9M7_9FUNG|nr:hypothetical protein DSO57_1039321 [Entomophthora muscae]